jgi:hypothetical protein
LERWTVTNPCSPAAWKVIDYALGRILKATEYVANAATFRRLAVPLPFVATVYPFEANKTLQRFLSQLLIAQGRGPSVEYVRFGLLLAEAEATWDPGAGYARIEQLAYTAANLDEADRADALAWILRLLVHNGPDLSLQSGTLVALVEADLVDAIDTVLARTADHGRALRGVISALVPVRCDIVSAAIGKANIRERRDSLRVEAVGRLLRPSERTIDFPFLCTLIGDIEVPSVRDGALYYTLQQMTARSEELPQTARPVLGRCMGIQSAPIRVLACSLARAICGRASSPDIQRMVEPLRNATEAAISQINSAWDRVDIGFAAATHLARTDRSLAELLCSKAEEIRSVTPFADQGSTWVYLTAVRLAVRAFAGVVAQKVDFDESLAQLRRLIARIPSDGERARLWGDLAERSYYAGAVELANRICDSELSRAVENIADPAFVAFVLVDVAPALFRRHSISALNRIAKLDYSSKNDAIANICRFLMTGRSSNDPQERTDRSYDIEYSTALDILECLKCCDRDYTVAFILLDLCEALASEQGVQKVTKGQRAEIERLLAEVIDANLPTPAGVQHDGYKVLSRGGLLLLRQGSQQSWEDLLEKAEALTNVADRTFTLAVLASIVPAKFDDCRSRAIAKATELSDQIAIPGDKVGRLEVIAQAAARFDVKLAKTVLEMAWRLSASRPGDLRQPQERMIDLAYRLDPKFAESLVACVESDPAHLRARLAVNQVRGSLRGSPSEEDLTKLSAGVIGDFGWSMLSSLNAGRVSHVHVEEAVPFIERAGIEMDAAYPVLSWVIQNSVSRYAGTGYGATHFLELFNAVVFGCELTFQVISNASGRREVNGEQRTFGSESGEIISPGEYRKAVERVSRWLDELKPAYLKISDPYFTPDDMQILMWIRDANPNCRVQMVIGEKKHRDDNVAPPYEESYRRHWRTVSAQDPPDTTVVIAGLVPTGDSPIHERWLVTGGRGLRLGTSFSGLGQRRESEIAELGEEAAREREAIIDRYLALPSRNPAGDRVRCSAFNLP